MGRMVEQQQQAESGVSSPESRRASTVRLAIIAVRLGSWNAVRPSDSTCCLAILTKHYTLARSCSSMLRAKAKKTHIVDIVVTGDVSSCFYICVIVHVALFMMSESLTGQ